MPDCPALEEASDQAATTEWISCLVCEIKGRKGRLECALLSHTHGEDFREWTLMLWGRAPSGYPLSTYVLVEVAGCERELGAENTREVLPKVKVLS